MKLKSLIKNQVNFSLSCWSYFASLTLSGVDQIYRSTFGAYVCHFLVSYSVVYDFLAVLIVALVFKVSNNVDFSTHIAMRLRRAYVLHLLLHLFFGFFLLLFFFFLSVQGYSVLVLIKVSQDIKLPGFAICSSRLRTFLQQVHRLAFLFCIKVTEKVVLVLLGSTYMK